MSQSTTVPSNPIEISWADMVDDDRYTLAEQAAVQMRDGKLAIEDAPALGDIFPLARAWLFSTYLCPIQSKVPVKDS